MGGFLFGWVWFFKYESSKRQKENTNQYSVFHIFISFFWQALHLGIILHQALKI